MLFRSDKWEEMAPIVRLLACVMPVVTLQILFSPATTALGHPRVQVLAAAAGAVIMPVAFLVGAQWGGVGMAWGWLIGFPLLALITARMAIPVIGTSAGAIWRAVCIALAGGRELRAEGIAATDGKSQGPNHELLWHVLDTTRILYLSLAGAAVQIGRAHV